MKPGDFCIQDNCLTLAKTRYKGSSISLNYPAYYTEWNISRNNKVINKTLLINTLIKYNQQNMYPPKNYGSYSRALKFINIALVWGLKK